MYVKGTGIFAGIKDKKIINLKNFLFNSMIS